MRRISIGRNAAIRLAVIVGCVLFTTSCNDLNYINPLLGDTFDLLIMQPPIDVCETVFGQGTITYVRQTYALVGFEWEPLGGPQTEWGFAPDDCYTSTGFDGLQDATDLAAVGFLLALLSPNDVHSSVNSRVHAATSTPQQLAGDQPAYSKDLPVQPPFSRSALSKLQPKCDPRQSYYSVNHANSTVTHFGTCPLHKIVSIPVADAPLEGALTPDARLLLVTSFSGPVTFIDTSTDQVVGTVSSPGTHPSGIAISPDGARAYVTSYTVPGALLLIDVVNRKITGSIPLTGYARNVFFTPDGSQAWINYLGSSQITIVDTLTNTAGAALTLSAAAEAGIAFNPTGTRAYIATRAGTIAVIDTATLNSVASIAVGSWPVDVIVTPDGRRVFVDDFSPTGTLAAIDTATNKVISTLNVGKPLNSMVMYPQNP